MGKDTVEGLWKATLEMELVAEKKLQTMLKPYEPITEMLYECGVEVATLKSKRAANNDDDLIVAALFLKRCLNDFRTIWRLLNLGYTSQAGSIAAAMFEHALMISAVIERPDRAEKVINTDNLKSPWSAQQLCNIEVEAMEHEAKITGSVMTKEEKDKEFNTLYSLYKWLCKIKHPTMMYVQHDAGSTSLQENYVIMAAPDIGILNLPIKFNILSIAIGRLHTAVRRFALGMGLDHEDKRVAEWLGRFNNIIPASVAAFKSLENIEVPVQIKVNKGI